MSPEKLSWCRRMFNEGLFVWDDIKELLNEVERLQAEVFSLQRQLATDSHAKGEEGLNKKDFEFWVRP